ncbi:MAG: hypothetical protein QOJ59_885 [Thermomicrobiales bacterium]|jgi:uncharacterized protein YvpB|nr:hypothetical protein [Thermomicrobiales bacterium]
MRRALPVSVVLSLLLGMASGMVPRQRAEAAGMRDVNAWIELSSTRPGVGCAVDVSVEIRESGHAVSQTEVSLALFIGEDVVSSDQAVTDGEGIAHLSVDTSGTYGGAKAWMDVNVASAYLTGFSVFPTSDGSCDDGGKLIETSGVVPAVQVESVSSAAPSVGNPDVSVWVPAYQQERNLSCEYAALQIATAAWGNSISEYAFDDLVGFSPNPHWGYRGNILGAWGNTQDYGVYAEVLASALDQFGFRGDVFYAGGDNSQLTARLDAGAPTVVWLALWGDQRVWEETEGVTYTLVPGMHVMVAYGYDSDGVYLSDPGIGGYRFYSWGDFMAMWNVLDGMALGVAPY